MALVNDADVQVHLPVDILKVEEVPDDKAVAYEDAERIVRGYLAGVFEPATLAAWVDPDSTPSQIRAVAGRFAAAKIYRLRFGGSATSDPEFAQNLYDEAMAMLTAIINGTLVLDDVDDPSLTFTNEWFEPNNASDPPKFTMADRY